MASRFHFGLGLLLALGFLTACHRQSNVVAGIKSQTCYIGLRDDPSDLDPHTNISASTQWILSALFDGLVDLKNDGKTIVPGVATHWETSADGKTYTFHLRPDAKWSNGDPLTSRDFLLSFQRVFDPLLGSETAAAGFAIAGAEDYALGRNKKIESLGIAAPDPATLVITLAHPAPYLLTVLARDPFYPVHFPSVEKFHGVHQRGMVWTRPENLICNGPFTLKTWVGNQVVIVAKNFRFWDADHIQLSEIHFIPTEDELVEERAFRAGQLDVTFRFPTDKAASYLAAHSTELRISPYSTTNYLSFNTTRAPFTDARVRLAFSLAIDREKLLAAVYGPLATPIHGLTQDGTGGYRPPLSPALRFDPAEAKRLLAEAGYKNPAQVPTVELMLSGNEGTILKVGEVLQEMWVHNLGVKVTDQPTEFKTYLEAERTKHFQVVIEGWLYGWDDPTDPLQLGKTGNPNNDAGWSNREYDRLYDLANQSTDPAIRKQAFDEMETIMAHEVAYAPLYSQNNAHLVQSIVQGWHDNPLNLVDWRPIVLAAPATQ